MYDESIYEKYPFFNNIKMENLIDSLTKVIARRFIIDYAHYLIRAHKPYYFGIIDLDNFKEINDSYGHNSGDIVLEKFGTTLAEFIGDRGLVGRYGGDEFVIIMEGFDGYDEIHPYIKNMVSGKTVVRRNYKCDDEEIFLTATFGLAGYPNDADNYDELFLKADKALYRGKLKGRNCYITYVDEKHRDVDISQKAKLSLPIIIDDISHIVESKKSFDTKVLEIIRYLNYDILGTKDTLVISNDMRVIYPQTNIVLTKLNFEMIDNILDVNGFVAVNQRILIEPYAKKLFHTLREFGFHSFVISKIALNKKQYGYLAVVENKNTRVWQKQDMGLIKYISKVLAYLYEKKGD